MGGNIGLGLVAAAGVAMMATGGVMLHNEASFEPNEYAFDYVCEALEADCSELETPNVRFGPFKGLRGALGLYWHSQDPESVYLDISYVDAIESGNLEVAPRAWEVLIHETAHYVDRHLGITDGSSCAAETLGWHMGNTWLLDHGYYDLAVWNWYTRYDNCDAPQGS